MNIARVAVLSVAIIAAGGAALVVRGGMNRANQARKAAPVETSVDDVLVATGNIEPGHPLDPASVHWQTWPKSAVAVSFITKTKQPDSTKAIAGLIVRSPLVGGEPLTDTNTVHADTTGFMAATLTPGMRAISVTVSAQTGAGGFILPNDRVDVLLTRDQGGNGGKSYQSETLLKDVRVLAIDQTIQQDKDKQSVVGHTATLELTPQQSELIAQSEQSGVISLALRSLGDSDGMPVTVEHPPPQLPAEAVRALAEQAEKDSVRVYRAGVLQGSGAAAGGAGPGGVAQPGIGAQAIPNALGAAL